MQPVYKYAVHESFLALLLGRSAARPLNTVKSVLSR